MKYQSLSAFENHLKQAAPNHFSPIYIVGVGAADERKKIIGATAALLKQKENGADLSTIDLREEKSTAALLALQTPSLFAPSSILILENMDELKKGELELFVSHFLNPLRGTFLICGCSSTKSLEELYQKGKKDSVMLDLTGEKPWDKKERIIRWIKELVAKEKKVLSPDLLAHLIDTMGLGLSHLENEVNKLICYVGERSEIKLADAKALPGFQAPLSLFELADLIVFGRGTVTHSQLSDLSFLLPLIGQVRSLLQTGRKIAFLRETGEDREGICRALPTVRSPMLDKCQSYSEGFFKQGLIFLFELELSCKSTPLPPPLLFNNFISKLRHAAATA